MTAPPTSPGWPGPQQAEVLARVADALPWPLWLLHADARLLFANQAARAALARGHPLQCTATGRLRPAAAGRRGEFELALGAATAGAVQTLHWPGRDGGHMATLRPLPASRALVPDTVLMLALGPADTHEAAMRVFAVAFQTGAADGAASLGPR